MKKALRLVGIVAAILVVLVIAACFTAPKIAKGYIEDHSKELVGRRLQIGDISFNPLRFTISVDDFTLFEKDDSAKFVAFKQFYVNIDPSCLLIGDICLSEVKIDSPYARVMKNGGIFNFTDILNKFAASADSAKAEAVPAVPVDTLAADSAKVNVAEQVNALPFGISIQKIAILSGDVIFIDQEVNSNISIRDFSVKIPEVYFSNQNTSAGVNLEFVSGGSLGVNADLNMEKGDFAVNVKLNQFAIGMVKPYLESVLNFKDLSGVVCVDISVAGNLSNVMASTAKGTVVVDDVVLTENSGKTIGVAHMGVGIAEANLNENRFVIDSVMVKGAYAHFDLNQNSNNIKVLLSAKAKTPSKDSAAVADSVLMALPDTVQTAVSAKENSADAPAKKLDALLKLLSVSDTKFTFNDNTIKGGFSYTVSGISVNASNVAFDRQASVNVSASLPRGGSAKVSAKLMPADQTSLKANIAVKNVNMVDLSKYSEHYTGYPLTAGSFGFASDNVIQNYNIDSKNMIDIYNLTVGDKPSDAEPEYMVPMKIGLYILKDKDGKISFDVPVKGNLQDPEFSYGKIIWQTVMNLMIKVALSPAKLLLGSSVPSDFAFDIAADDFTSEQYGVASEWTKVLSKKPGAKLTVLQVYNPKKQIEAFALSQQKIAYYKSHTGKTSLTPVDMKAALETAEDEGFKQFAATWKRPSDEALMAQLNALAEERNATLLKALSAQPGVTAKNLKVRLASPAERGSIGKKSEFRMSVELP